MILPLILVLFNAVGCENHQHGPSPYSEDYQCHGKYETNWDSLGDDIVHLQWKLKNIEISVRTNQQKLDELNSFLHSSLTNKKAAKGGNVAEKSNGK